MLAVSPFFIAVFMVVVFLLAGQLGPLFRPPAIGRIQQPREPSVCRLVRYLELHRDAWRSVEVEHVLG